MSETQTDEGRMTLVEHLTELRHRVIVSAVVLVVFTILVFIFYSRLLHFLSGPYEDVTRGQKACGAQSPNEGCKLIATGPYRYTRNPMYLGLVIVSLGIAILIGAWPMFLAPIAVFATANWVHIPFEEAKMRRQFGSTYDDYVGRVRRWV